MRGRAGLVLALLAAAACQTAGGPPNAPPPPPPPSEPASGEAAEPPEDQDTILTGNITVQQVPSRYRLAPTIETYGSLVAQLGQAGTLRLQSATLSLEGPTVLTADTLQLAASTVETKGMPLDIYVRRLVVDGDSQLISFTTYLFASFEWLTLNPRTGRLNPPSPGRSGQSGGRIRIFVAEAIEGSPNIRLLGTPGLNGGDGVPGNPGEQGRRGRVARERWGTCARGPGDGGTGGNGGAGGAAAAGGAGGDGGSLLVTYINVPAQAEVVRNFSAPRGEGGQGGQGGPGGVGGPGGRPGRGNFICGVSSRGGRVGPAGPRGADGPFGGPGIAGSASVETITIPN